MASIPASTTSDLGELLNEFAGLVAADLPGIFDRLDAESRTEVALGEGVQRFLRGAIIKAFASRAGPATLANHAGNPPGQLAAPESMLAAQGYLHRMLSALRERAFALYGHQPETCRRVIDGLHAATFEFGLVLARQVSDGAGVAARDPTTGLPGHLLVLRTLADELESHRAAGRPLAVLVIALSFAQVGIESGLFGESENLYRQAAARLSDALREEDTLGRLRRDRFALVLPGLPASGIAILAAAKLLRMLDAPFEAGGQRVLARTGIGIALHPEHSGDAESLLHFAEVSGVAARAVPEHYLVYDPEAHRQDRIKVTLESQLRGALHDNELEIYLQPQANTRDGKIDGAEALLRWRLKDGTPVAPGHAVAIAEDAGLISALTMWVFNSSLRVLAGLLDSGVAITMSLNVTPSNLADPELPVFIAQALATWQIPPGNLVIELTEGAMIGDTKRTLETLHQLKTLGVKLSVDDFGTGYSSLAYLKRMPLDELKIDQVFVRNMLSVREDERIVRSVINLAHHFDLQVVAEGVEDGETMAFLQALGCDAVQGYHIARPMPAGQFGWWWHNRAGVLLPPGR